MEQRLFIDLDVCAKGKCDPSTRVPAKAGDASLGISPSGQGVVLSEQSESKGEGCEVQCSYYYHQQSPGNNGIVSVAEQATYALVCRRCEEPHCVNACPQDALEQQKDKGKLLIRHPLRCISCKSCSHACPYGTIYPENVPLLFHNCDFCLDRRGDKDEPLCIKTCPHGALGLKSGDTATDENTFLVGDHLIVHSTHWRWEKA